MFRQALGYLAVAVLLAAAWLLPSSEKSAKKVPQGKPYAVVVGSGKPSVPAQNETTPPVVQQSGDPSAYPQVRAQVESQSPPAGKQTQSTTPQPPAQSVRPQSPTADTPTSLYLQGDSLSSDPPFQSALKKELRGWKVDIDAKSGRGVPEGLRHMRSAGLAPVVVFALGSNSWDVGPSGNRAWIRGVLERAGSERCVVLTTIVTDGKARREWNAQVSWAARTYGPRRVQVADWAARLRAGDIRLADGTHPAREQDEVKRADLIAGAVRRCAAQLAA